MFTIAQLEPYATGDPFERQLPAQPPDLHAEQQPSRADNILWIPGRVLRKRTIKKGRGMITEYLLRWKGRELEHDRWKNIKTLDALAKDVIKVYEQENGNHSVSVVESSQDTSLIIS